LIGFEVAASKNPGKQVYPTLYLALTKMRNLLPLTTARRREPSYAETHGMRGKRESANHGRTKPISWTLIQGTSFYNPLIEEVGVISDIKRSVVGETVSVGISA
jgi:hypothetical protein